MSTYRTYVEVQFINRFTGALVTIGKNLRADWSDMKRIEYVRQMYLRYSLEPHETLETFRFWAIKDSGEFRRAQD